MRISRLRAVHITLIEEWLRDPDKVWKCPFHDLARVRDISCGLNKYYVCKDLFKKDGKVKLGIYEICPCGTHIFDTKGSRYGWSQGVGCGSP